MKNIYEILTGIGLEIPEDKKEDFDKEWKENYRTIAEYEKAVDQRDKYKTSFDDAREELKKFDDVNVDELRDKIKDLETSLKTKDIEHANEKAQWAFSDAIKEAVKAAGGKNEKAITALLDMDALKESKNQSEDIKAALESIKESDAYLFGADEPINNPVGPTQNHGNPSSGLSAMRAAMGLPEEK